MGKPTGFLDYTRVDCPLRDAAARTGDYAPVELPLSERNRRRQSGRCMDCGVPFCQAGVSFEGVLLGCPLHNLIPEWNDLLWNGDYEGALQRLLKTSPFPEFTGRVCPALCERACVCGQVSQPVTIRENELSIIEYGFENDLMQPMLPAARSDKKIAVIGSGPAGVSAALYTARAGVDTTVLTRGPGALDRAEEVQNYYGFAAPISGAELERQGIEGAKAVGVKFVATEAVGLTYTDKLTVETLDGDYPADAVILATGAARAVPRIPGLAGLEGHGVSYCAACDAFFYRGRDVAVVGSGEYALHEVQALLPVASSVTLLLNGAPLAAQFPPEVTVRPEKIDAVLGEQKVTGVQLAGGEIVELAGVFIALGVAGSTALARKIGAAVENNRIVTDGKMQTTVPGLYAAGDCTGGLLQVAKAVYEGALAGTEAAKALRKE